MSTSNVIVAASATIIGNVSPYSYQVKPKTWDRANSAKQVKFGGEISPSRLTKGQGKGSAMRFYAYFMAGDYQHWVELTEATYTEMVKNPAFVLELTPRSVEQAAPVKDAPATEAPAEEPKKARRVKREAVTA
jgi:hypothetical protein